MTRVISLITNCFECSSGMIVQIQPQYKFNFILSRLIYKYSEPAKLTILWNIELLTIKEGHRLKKWPVINIPRTLKWVPLNFIRGGYLFRIYLWAGCTKLAYLIICFWSKYEVTGGSFYHNISLDCVFGARKLRKKLAFNGNSL